MRVFRALDNLPEFKNSVITIGSFDGVHTGHKAILKKLKTLARKSEGEVVVVTFHPHPRQVIYPNDDSLQLLNSIDEKIQLFEKIGIDNLVIVPFSVEFSQQSADEYVEEFLVKKFNPKYIVIGYDHRFGLNRQGDIKFLEHHAKRFNYEVVEIEKQTISDNTISSTQIRKALNAHQIKTANTSLGYNYLLTGKVIRGLELGKTLGFPTANLRIEGMSKLIPPDGIYATYTWVDGVRFQSMFYIGNRPTIESEQAQTLEVNIFDFNEIIYGKTIQLELVEHIRGDMKFTGLEGLKKQLSEDKTSALAILNKYEKVAKEKSINPSVGVVILNYNGKNHLRNFLPSVEKTTYPNATIYVADNGSTDDSIAFLQKEYAHLNIIQMPDNQGFAGGYNEALSTIEGKEDFYVLLNSDVEVTPNWLEPIVNLMSKDATIAACQPKILAFKNKANFEHAGAAGGWIDSYGYPFCRGRIFEKTEKDNGQYDTTSEVFWATGAAMVVRGDLYHRFEGLDADFFAHMEEIDLCWRLKNAGYKIMACPASVVYHVGGGTLDYHNPRKLFLNFRNSLFAITKNERKRKLFWLIPLRLVLDGVAAAKFLTEGKFNYIWAVLKAHIGFYSSIFGLLHKRKRISTIRKKDNSLSPKGVKRNRHGIFRGSVVAAHFIHKKSTFKEIVGNEK